MRSRVRRGGLLLAWVTPPEALLLPESGSSSGSMVSKITECSGSLLLHLESQPVSTLEGLPWAAEVSG